MRSIVPRAERSSQLDTDARTGRALCERVDASQLLLGTLTLSAACHRMCDPARIRRDCLTPRIASTDICEYVLCMTTNNREELIMTTSTAEFAIGDLVLIDHPRAQGVHRVVAKLPKNYRVEPVNGGLPVRCSPELMRAADVDAPVGVPFVPTEIFSPGQTVKLNGRDGIYVVLKSTQRGYSVALLGGDHGRYWNVPASALRIVEITYKEN